MKDSGYLMLAAIIAFFIYFGAFLIAGEINLILLLFGLTSVLLLATVGIYHRIGEMHLGT